ncbi:alpha/beta fold hydrolase [Herbiconiux sp. P15]|uniref:alpha/beta fold hydrolase n=1 Tax=Herbiconiux liukaitaii TaxID=3342799 RepID=UPI0035B8FD49
MTSEALIAATVLTPLGPVTVRCSARRFGDEAVVLLHGAAGSWTTWLPLLEAARRRGEPLHDVVLVDLPGWGATPLPPHGRSVDAYGRAVAEVLRALGYDRWHAVGHSLGGVIALHLASIEPAATLSVGLVSPTTFSIARAARHPVRGLRRAAPFVALRAAMITMAALSPTGTGTARALAAFRRLHLLRPIFAPLFARPSQVPAAVLETLAAEVRPAAFAAAARALADYRPGARWAGIRCPVVSVRGARDVFVSADDDRMLRRTIEGAVTRVLPDAGHFAHIESPDAVLDALAAPLGGIRSGRAESCARARG